MSVVRTTSEQEGAKPFEERFADHQKQVAKNEAKLKAARKRAEVKR